LRDGAPPSGWTLDRPPYHLATSVPVVLPAGDVRTESAKRVASAVGEGAMAVMLVHRYLDQLCPPTAPTPRATRTRPPEAHRDQHRGPHHHPARRGHPRRRGRAGMAAVRRRRAAR